jgi:hypothetical protein
METIKRFKTLWRQNQENFAVLKIGDIKGISKKKLMRTYFTNRNKCYLVYNCEYMMQLSRRNRLIYFSWTVD